MNRSGDGKRENGAAGVESVRRIQVVQILRLAVFSVRLWSRFHSHISC